ncbi:MAG: T9SS type A sorting domain-containing protein, partial [Bacteroidia bacterium]
GLNAVNSSTLCGMYVRDSASNYDNMKIYPNSKLVDVSPYATFTSLKIKMKIYSTAPVGTVVQLQLGSKNDDTYPAGVNSEYLASTSVKNAWQILTFDFWQIPSGSMVASTDVDKFVLLYHPGSYERDTMYFDDLTGPELAANSIQTESLPIARLYQNNPNPAKETTHINFQINTPGFVSLKLYDILGNSISSLVNENMKTGNYSIPVETENIPNGVYFYTLETNGMKRSMKMIISN